MKFFGGPDLELWICVPRVAPPVPYQRTPNLGTLDRGGIHLQPATCSPTLQIAKFDPRHGGLYVL
jgi:hypothetical protein